MKKIYKKKRFARRAKASGLSENYKKEIHFESLLKFLYKEPFFIHIEGDIETGKSTLQGIVYLFC